ncbi:hypothetical protein ACXZ65_16450 [Streptomyces aculeolatus]|uniref:hypothetical protein n=1 Tax=Streptomyces aculeolatus TaxID=270689 RepID=UPI00037F63EB|nr:hypothetical protein [Streptomyces aculeolatus]
MYDYEIHRARSTELRREAEQYRMARGAVLARRARGRRSAAAGDGGGAAARRGSWVKAA